MLTKAMLRRLAIAVGALVAAAACAVEVSAPASASVTQAARR
jgi:hypothetical protein